MNKIDLIIDALDLARNEIHDPTLWTDKVDEALAAARELRALKPVAQIRIKNGHWIDTPVAEVKGLADGVHILFALDEVKHD